MAQVRLDDAVPHHPKFLRAGPVGCWLYVCSIAYCQRLLTDGFISADSVHTLGVDLVKYDFAIQALVDARLWDVVDGGWRIHHYLDHNKTAKQVKSIIKKRKVYGRLGGLAHAKQTGKQPANQIAKQTAKQVPKQSGLADRDRDRERDRDRDRTCSTPQQAGCTDARTAPPKNGANGPHPVETVENSENEQFRKRLNRLLQTQNDPKRRLARAPADDGNYRVIATLARTLLSEQTFSAESELVDAVKWKAAQNRIDYGAHPDVATDVVHRACASEWFKFQHPDIAGAKRA